MFINGVPYNGMNISPLRMQGNWGSTWIATTWVAYGCPKYQRQSVHDRCNTSSMDLLIEGDAPPKYSPCCNRWLRRILHWCLHPSYLSCMDYINLRATLYTNLCAMHSPMRDTLVQSLSKSPCQLWNSWSKCLTSNSLMSFLTSASLESRGWDFSKGGRVVTTQKPL